MPLKQRRSIGCGAKSREALEHRRSEDGVQRSESRSVTRSVTRLSASEKRYGRAVVKEWEGDGAEEKEGSTHPRSLPAPRA